MGIHFNPSNDGFAEALRSEIYIDKSNLLAYLNGVIQTQQKYVCVSRPRRFGKTMAASMLTAYYSLGCDSADMFNKLNITCDSSFNKNINTYNVIFVNMQDFLSETKDIDNMIDLLISDVTEEIIKEYVEFKGLRFVKLLNEVYESSGIPFVFIIDEWDCVFRIYREDANAQEKYLDFLRLIFKDKPYIGLAYMTGILPIKKYGVHSALNMFSEFSMIEPRQMAPYTGFTQVEVAGLCAEYHMDYDEIAAWYDGYRLYDETAVYNPNSVISAILSRQCSNYWSQTETYEALKIYIDLNYEGLKDSIIQLLAGGRIIIETSGFTNDMVTFTTSDDILTLLVHLGYLGYDSYSKEVFIPNKEISSEFVTAVRRLGWNNVKL